MEIKNMYGKIKKRSKKLHVTVCVHDILLRWKHPVRRCRTDDRLC